MKLLWEGMIIKQCSCIVLVTFPFLFVSLVSSNHASIEKLDKAVDRSKYW